MRKLLLSLFLLIATTANAAVTKVSGGDATAHLITAASSVSWSVDVGSSANRGIAILFFYETSLATVTSVTYNSVTLTYSKCIADTGSFMTVCIYADTTTATGSNTAAVNFSGNTSGAANHFVVSNVDPISPLAIQDQFLTLASAGTGITLTFPATISGQVAVMAFVGDPYTSSQCTASAGTLDWKARYSDGTTCIRSAGTQPFGGGISTTASGASTALTAAWGSSSNGGAVGIVWREARAAMLSDAGSAESHTGTTGSASEASFTFNLIPRATLKGILVFTSTIAAADVATSVTAGGQSLTEVASGSAVDAAGEPGTCKAWFLGTGIPTDNPLAIVVNRTNNASVMYATAVGISSSGGNTQISGTPVLLEGDGTVVEQNVDTSSTVGLRFACAYSGLASPDFIPAGANSTKMQSVDLGSFGVSLTREIYSGSGSRPIGFVGSSDDRAGVHLAVSEIPAFSSTEDQEFVTEVNGSVGDLPISFLSPPTANCTATASFIGSSSIDMAFATPAVDDNQGNTYTATQSAVAGQAKALIAAADNISVGGTFIITFHPDVSTNPVYAQIALKSFCGLANPAIDKTATAADPGPQAADANVSTAATSQANETIIVAAAMCEYSGDTNMNVLTPTTGYTTIQSEQDCSATGTAAGDISWKNVTAAGVQSANWSHDDIVSSGGYNGWAAAIVTLKDSDPGSVPAATRRRSVIVQ